MAERGTNRFLPPHEADAGATLVNAFYLSAGRRRTHRRASGGYIRGRTPLCAFFPPFLSRKRNGAQRSVPAPQGRNPHKQAAEDSGPHREKETQWAGGHTGPPLQGCGGNPSGASRRPQAAEHCSRALDASLSRLAPSATAGFAAAPGKSIRACGPPWVLPVAPLHPACSRALGASDKKGAASAAPLGFCCAIIRRSRC